VVKTSIFYQWNRAKQPITKELLEKYIPKYLEKQKAKFVTQEQREERKAVVKINKEFYSRSRSKIREDLHIDHLDGPDHDQVNQSKHFLYFLQYKSLELVL